MQTSSSHHSCNSCAESVGVVRGPRCFSAIATPTRRHPVLGGRRRTNSGVCAAKSSRALPSEANPIKIGLKIDINEFVASQQWHGLVKLSESACVPRRIGTGAWAGACRRPIQHGERNCGVPITEAVDLRSHRERAEPAPGQRSPIPTLTRQSILHAARLRVPALHQGPDAGARPQGPAATVRRRSVPSWPASSANEFAAGA